MLPLVSALESYEGQEVLQEVIPTAFNLPVAFKEFRNCVAELESLNIRFAIRSFDSKFVHNAVRGKNRLNRDVNLAAESLSFKVDTVVASVPLADEISVRHDGVP
jgi:alkyl hydroperoxide reductase subunit AhpC